MICGLIKHFFVCLFVPLYQVWKDDWIISNKRTCVWLSSLHWGSIVMLLGHRIFIKFFFPFVGRMVFGYAYPAYECYKAVEKNKPEIQQLRFWCQYWFVICLFFSRLFLSWAFSFLKVKTKVLSSSENFLAGFWWLLWPFSKELGILLLPGWCYWI